jgi:hypothetical protein
MNTTARTTIHTSARSVSWPSLDQLWAIATVTLLALRVQLTPIAPNDFWWHIATGRLIAQSGRVPLTDQFSYSQPGAAYFNQPWLAQLLMYGGYQLGGAALLELLQAVLIGASFGLLYAVCRREGAGPRVATLATLAGALVAMDNWQIRPQTYAVPLFIATLAIVTAWRRGRRAPLWALPLIMLVWVNLHGTFTLLLALCGLSWAGVVGERLWRGRRLGARGFAREADDLTVRSPAPDLRSLVSFTLWSGAALLATAINPRGVAIWRYVFGLLSNRAVSQLVTEWASPIRDLASPMTIVFFVLLSIFAGVTAWRWRRLTLTDWLLIGPFLLLALQSVRNILWFGIVVTPIAARLLMTETPRRRPVEVALMNRLIAGLLALLLAATLPWWKETIGLPPALGDLLGDQTPVAATERLLALPQRPQRLFHEMGFGSYLIWAAPEQRIFVDPRIELYPYQQWRDYITLGQGKEIDELARRYGFDGWLVNPATQADLLAALDRNPDWRRVFSTDEAVYFAPRLSAALAR